MSDYTYDELMDMYLELILAVEDRFPRETRHQTALRYIREAENNNLDEKCLVKQANKHE